MAIVPASTPISVCSRTGPAMDPPIEKTIAYWKYKGFLTETPEGLGLDLSKLVVRQQDIDGILWLLNKDLPPPHLISLNLTSSHGVFKEAIDTIARALKNNIHLTDLFLEPSLPIMNDLFSSRNDSQSGEQLALALTVNTTLARLHFLGQSIGDSGALQFAAALQINSSLTSICLGRNRFQPNGISTIAQALIGNSSLLCLDLSGNHTGKAYPKIAELVTKNSTLTALDVRENHIPEQGAEAIAVACLANTSITHLDYRNNLAIDGTDKVFAKVVRSNTTLNSLRLSDMQLSDADAPLIGNALSHYTTLTSLHIGWPMFINSQQRYPALAAGLYFNGSITSLILSKTDSLIKSHLDRNTWNKRKREETLFGLLLTVLKIP